MHTTSNIPAYTFTLRVYLEDTDAGGIVYHANHLKYMERTRREWLRFKGLEHYSARDDYQFVVHSSSLRYIKPLFMDDEVSITVFPKKIGHASLVLFQDIYRHTLPTQLPVSELNTYKEHLVTKAEVTLACVNKHLKPCKLPNDLVSIFKQI